MAREGCLAGDDGTCLPPTPCLALHYTCDAPSLEVGRVQSARDRSPGLDALAARGDFVLGNDRFRAVFDDVGAPHYLAPSGGNLLDLVPRDHGALTGDDELNQVLHAVGILPGDAVHYRRVDVVDGRPAFVALVARGALDGRPAVSVVTRYEARPCEPGLRVRTELFHGGREPETFFLGDAFYWGGRESAPFAPTQGRGFEHPDLDLAELGKGFVSQPFMVAKPGREGAAAYGLVACRGNALSGFHSSTVSAMGLERTIVMPGDSLVFERLLLVAPAQGTSTAPVANLAQEARGQLYGDATVEVRGRVVHASGAPVTPQDRVGLLFYQVSGDDQKNQRVPWSEAAPDAEGRFRVRLPADRALRFETHLFGRPLPLPTPFETTRIDRELPDVVVPDAGILDVTVKDETGAPLMAEVVLTPEGATPSAPGTVYGAFALDQCAPLLGAPHGASPACNRALLDRGGAASFPVPAGSYWVYATQGPFATLSRTRVDVVPGTRASAALVVERLPALLPPGALSGDFHVHGGASFDSSLPDADRARSFVATGVDVLAATDHDVVTTYERAIAELGIGDRVRVLPGAETTGHVLFYRPPGSTVPKVVGHYNFWPLRYDAELPRNGMPWDELLEPGPLFDRMAAQFVGKGVIQFNHPLSVVSFGRDEGFLTAIDFDARKRIPASADGSHEGELRRRGTAGGRSALDFDVQEVMNGTSTQQFRAYRLAWFSFLDQGIVRGGTANSDSHTLGVELLGYPRNLVLGAGPLTTFDAERFDALVREGRMIGTNGPVIVAEVEGHGPSLAAFRPSADAGLSLEVRAAPWIPVEEIRIVVNGVVKKTLAGAALQRPVDPFGKAGLVRYRGSIPLRELLAGLDPALDAYIVVEAGLPYFPAADLDDDGYVDTTDNDGNGRIDDADHAGRREAEYYVEPRRPAPNDPRFHAAVVAPGHWATAFTNPLLLDFGAPGWTGPGRP
jgi:hypothetical protein